MPALQIGQELARSPGGMLLSRLNEERLDLRRRLVRMSLDGMASISERRQPALSVAGEPLVGRLATDAEASSEFGGGVEAALVGLDEGGAFEHGMGMGPGHGSAPLGKTMQVNRLSPIKPG